MSNTQAVAKMTSGSWWAVSTLALLYLVFEAIATQQWRTQATTWLAISPLLLNAIGLTVGILLIISAARALSVKFTGGALAAFAAGIACVTFSAATLVL
jgi:hypothetical protein